MVVPFNKPRISGAEIKQLIEGLEEGWLTTGTRPLQFEQEFANCVGRKCALAVNTCTAGLQLALETIHLKAGQGVLVPTMATAANAEVVRHFDARPIFVDCNPNDFNLDMADAEQRMEQAASQGIDVAAIIPVHFAGQIGDVAGVRQLAQTYNLKVIENVADCYPAYYREDGEPRWKTVGTSADISCFSFETDKFSSTGEGGMVCTDVDEYAERMSMLSLPWPGYDTRKPLNIESHPVLAPRYKYGLSDVASAIGLHQLRKADKLQMLRTRAAGYYEHLLGEVEEISLPIVHPDRIHSWQLYVIRLNLEALSINRAELLESLHKAGIITSLPCLPLHMHTCYAQAYGYRPEDLLCAGRVCQEFLTLPIYPEMTLEEAEYVSYHLKEIIAQHPKLVYLSAVNAGFAEEDNDNGRGEF